jgi:hypothetical protein
MRWNATEAIASARSVSALVVSHDQVPEEQPGTIACRWSSTTFGVTCRFSAPFAHR